MFTNHDNRPDIRPERTSADWATDISSLLIVVVSIAWALSAYASLPAKIPLHFNFSGQPNSWGHKAFIFLIPGITVLLWLMLTGIGMLPPRYYNYPVPITEKNAAYQYRNVRQLLGCLKVETAATFLLIEWMIIHTARGNSPPGPWVVFVIVGVIFATIGFFLVQSIRHR